MDENTRNTYTKKRNDTSNHYNQNPFIKVSGLSHYVSIELNLHTIDTDYTIWPTNPVYVKRKCENSSKNFKICAMSENTKES
jgi:hypothetical protein